MFENPRRGKKFYNKCSEILDLKSSSEQVFSQKLPLGAPELSHFSAFKMVYSPKTFLKNLFEMLINLTSPKWAQMVYVVNNLCWLAT